MFKGTLTLSGGITCGEADVFRYNGSTARELTFVATGHSPQDVQEKLRKVLPDVDGIAFAGASKAYAADVAALPMKASARLDNKSFCFNLNYDDYDDLIAGARWELERSDGKKTIILQ